MNKRISLIIDLYDKKNGNKGIKYALFTMNNINEIIIVKIIALLESHNNIEKAMA
jgi:hypothetical protein